jgi:uncharacterized protein YjcR
VADQKDKARKDYESGMKYKDIAEKYNVTLNTVKSWKTRYKWSRKGMHTNEKSVHTKKRGGQPGNKNAIGNNGGPPQKNTNSIKHGFFAKHLPEEAFEIMKEIQEADPIDLLWSQIMIQYTAIIRAQKIMFVQDKEDITKELKKEKRTDTGWEDEYEIQFAWDKHAAFLNAQSRAMSELRSSIKQFKELADTNDERRMKLELMQLDIEKSKVELGNLRGDTEGNAHEQVNSYVEALNGQVEDVFADEVKDDEEA